VAAKGFEKSRVANRAMPVGNPEELDPILRAKGIVHSAGSARAKKAAAGPEKKGEVKTPALRRLAATLRKARAKGDMDPVIGRKNEIERVIQILCRRTKNNPVLLGEAGVGKTAIVGRSRAGDRGGHVRNFAEQTRHHA